MKKRVFCVLLTICMIARLFPTAVFADDPEPTAGLKITYGSTVKDTVEVTINIGDLNGTFPFTLGESSGTLTFTNGEAIINIYDGQTLLITGLPENEIVDLETTDGFLATPAGSTILSKGKIVSFNITEDSPEIINNLDLSKTSGSGWEYDKAKQTLKISDGYQLNGTSEISCKKLVLNGIITGGSFPDTRDITGSGVILNGVFPNENMIIGEDISVKGGMFAKAGNDTETDRVTVSSEESFTITSTANGVSVKYPFEGSSVTFYVGKNTRSFKIDCDNFSSLYIEGGTSSGKEFTISGDADVTVNLRDDSWTDDNIIKTAAQLEDFAYSVNNGEDFTGKTITLGADIDLSNVTHLPIGDEDNNFFGTFDGNCHTITLGSVSASFQSGLFGCVGEGAVVKNLNVKGSLKFAMAGQKSIFYYCLGSIAGSVESDAMIYNCISDVEFNVESNVNLTVGGLVGFLGGSLLNSAFNGELTTYDNLKIGALVGETGSESVVGNCYSATYPDLIGGTSPDFMKHCYATSGGTSESDDAIALPLSQMTADSGTSNGDDWLDLGEFGKAALVDVLNLNLDTIDEEMSDLDLKPWVNDKETGLPVFGQVIYPEPQITIIDNLSTIINLTEGYTDTTVYKFEIVGKVNAEISGDGDYIKFDDNDKKMTIIPGLKAGTYTLVLTASSGSYQYAMLTITIDVSEKQCNHSFEWIIDKEPTYTSTGLKHKKCTICHEIQNENTIIDKLEKDDIPIIISNAFVCFETNGGSKIDRLMTLFGSKVDLMKYIPERDGYEFDGWYSDKELTKFVTSIRAVGVTTVYAKWVREALPFVDVDTDSEYYDDISFVFNKGLMIGTSDLSFSPEMTLTRGMVVTILWRINGSPVVNYAMDFTDVSPDDYYAEAIRWAQSEKIVNGIGDKLFAPESPVTREQLAAIIYRFVQRNGDGFTGMWYFPLNYTDASEISAYADEAMHWCVMNGIIESDDDNNLRPTAPASRAETARAYHIFSTIYGLD